MKRRSFLEKIGIAGITTCTTNTLYSAHFKEDKNLKDKEELLKNLLWKGAKIQASADFLHHTKYVKYIKSNNKEEIAQFEKDYEILQISNSALEKILNEAPKENVEKGNLALWHLYGIGYVIKTPTVCFGIDIHHKHSQRLAKILDFSLSTHNHLDHFSPQHIDEMEKLGKPYVSNFVENQYKTNTAKIFKFGEITVKTSPSDHPPALKNFVLNFEIDCGNSTNNTVIYHTGDSHLIEQLNPTKPVDILIGHVQGELDLPALVKKLNPKVTLVSHLLELSWGQFRWSIASGVQRAKECNGLAFPLLWGEKFIYNKK